MNKTYTNLVLRLLSRLIQEYEVDIKDARFSDAERDILQLAGNEQIFYGKTYIPVQAGHKREPSGTAKGK